MEAVKDLDSIIKEGHLISNRTFRYIVPGLQMHGHELWRNLGAFPTLATGIKDELFKEEEDAIFLLLNIKGRMVYNKYIDAAKSTLQFYEMLSWYKEQSYYIADYPYNSGRDKFLHMIVLRHPIKGTIKKFIDGSYSTMYSEADVKKVFPKESREYQIVQKTPEGKEEFRKYLNLEYNLTGRHELKTSDIDETGEYDIPPNLNQETFRWKKINQFENTNAEMKTRGVRLD